MKAFHYRAKMRFAGGRAYRFGDSPDQDSSQTSTNTTQSYDQRQINTSTSYDLQSTSNYDLSQRTSNSGNNSNNSYSTDARVTNNTTNTTDARTTYNTNTDFGAVQSALDFAGGAVQLVSDHVAGVLGLASSVVAQDGANVAHAYDYADSLFAGSLDAINRGEGRALDAYDRAAMLSESAIDKVQNAYADAKGTTQANQKMMLAALAVAGVAVLATVARKG